MATEELVIVLDSDTSGLNRGLSSATNSLEGMDESVNTVDRSLLQMARDSNVAGKSLKVVAAASAAAMASTIGMTKALIDYAKEVRLASQLSGIAADELQIMASATASVGIGIEQIGDISKDTRERIGDFLNTGGGGFQDFADAMKLTKAEAKATAIEFQHMSGTDVLQEMVIRMEDAEVSAVQMSHALEGMASETTRLIPLLSDGGREFKSMAQSARELTIPLTDEDIEKIAKVEKAVELASKSMTNLAHRVLIDLSEEFVEATENVAHFWAALNEGTIASKTSRLADIKDEIEDLTTAMDLATEREGTFLGFILSNTKNEEVALSEINELIKERVELQKEVANLSGLTTPSSSPESTGASELSSSPSKAQSSPVFLSADDAEKQLQVIRDRFKSEEELIEAKYLKDIEFIERNVQSKLEENELLLNLELEFDESIRELRDKRLSEEQKRIDDRVRDEDKANRKIAKDKRRKDRDDKKSADQELKSQNEIFDSAITIGNALFEDNKAVQAGIVVAKTGNAVMHQLGSGDPYTAFARAGAAAAIGVAQLASTLSAQKGGGSVSSVSSSPPSSSALSDQESVSGEFEVNETVTQGSNSSSVSNTLSFTADDADELGTAFANVLNNKIKSGEFTLGG